MGGGGGVSAEILDGSGVEPFTGSGVDRLDPGPATPPIELGTSLDMSEVDPPRIELGPALVPVVRSTSLSAPSSRLPTLLRMPSDEGGDVECCGSPPGYASASSTEG